MVVAIVGVDCAGKTTQVANLLKVYQGMGVDVKAVCLRDKPTVEHLASHERRLCPNPSGFPPLLSGDQYAVAYNCDFYNHYCANILRLIQQDPCPLVLSDRYTVCYEAFAYAVEARSEISHHFLRSIVPPPDLEICLDIDMDVVLKRIETRQEPRSLDETCKILKAQIEFYRSHFGSHKNRYMVDASKPVTLVTDAIFSIIESKRS